MQGATRIPVRRSPDRIAANVITKGGTRGGPGSPADRTAGKRVPVSAELKFWKSIDELRADHATPQAVGASPTPLPPPAPQRAPPRAARTRTPPPRPLGSARRC